MQIDHHAVLNAISRAIILCDADPEEAKENLYALGDYLKDYFSATVRKLTPATDQDLQKVEASLQALNLCIQGKRGG